MRFAPMRLATAALAALMALPAAAQAEGEVNIYSSRHYDTDERLYSDFEEATGIDLAPMLDFVLNLLIFFIITAVFAKELSFAMNRPGAQAGTSGKESSNIVINIQEDGEVWVDKRIVDIRAVRANVERLSALKPDWGVLIIAHENAETGFLIGVADQVRMGGVSNITFSTVL